MDPKLYKTLKQLIKLGILTKNTKVVRRRRKRNGKTSQSTRSVYRIQNPAGNVSSVQQHSTPTVQSEQAIVNLKASEFQLEKALQNNDLPDDSKQKVILAIEDIKNQIAEQRTVTKNAYYNLDYRIMGVKHDVSKRYDEPEQSSYSQFVPQTKPNKGMSNNMGLLGNAPYIAPTSHDWIHYDNKEKDDVVEQMDNPIGKLNIADKWVGWKDEEPVSKPKAEPEEPEHKEPEHKEPEHKEPEHKESEPIRTRSKANIQALREEYAELANVDVANVKKNLTKSELEENINNLKIKNLQQQYRDNGGDSKTYLSSKYNNVPGLEMAVKRLIANKLNYAD